MILPPKLKSALIVISGGTSLFMGMQLIKGNEFFYQDVIMPVLRSVDAETAHIIAVKAAKWGLIPQGIYTSPILKTKLWGKEFINPVGLAAGFDKHGEAVSGLFRIGFGFVEIGSVTPLPQNGNPKPRVFRLEKDKGIINRYGFNSAGFEVVHQRLKSDSSKKKLGILGINLGKNKTSDHPVEDFAEGVKKFSDIADYLVINISSPNTPGLRNMQSKQQLENLLEKVKEVQNLISKENSCPPLLIKLAPDLNYLDLKDAVSVIINNKYQVDGIIVSNTTISRPADLKDSKKTEIGGLSGKPLKQLALKTLHDVYKLTNGKIPIIGAGGISNGKDAYERICAGASLIQIYTALVYEGPLIVNRINKELEQLLKADGFTCVEDAIGSDFRKSENSK